MRTVESKLQSVMDLIESLNFTAPELRRLYFEVNQRITRGTTNTKFGFLRKGSVRTTSALDEKLRSVMDLVASLKFTRTELDRLNFELKEKTDQQILVEVEDKFQNVGANVREVGDDVCELGVNLGELRSYIKEKVEEEGDETVRRIWALFGRRRDNVVEGSAGHMVDGFGGFRG